MQLIAHRGLWNDPKKANTLEAFKRAFDAGVGIETDVRSFRGQLFLSHDIIMDSGDLPHFPILLEMAEEYPERPLFLNIKEDGLLGQLAPFKPRLKKLNTVFFDMSVPELVQYARHFPPSMLAARVSDVEPYPSGIEFCEWIWVDGFFRELTLSEIKELFRRTTQKCAFVSPELHGRDKLGFWNLLGLAPWIPKDRIFLCTDHITQAGLLTGAPPNTGILPKEGNYS